MSERVRITDVSPRDGLQNEPGVIPAEQKVELVRLLCETGVDEVEVTSFVSPKWVPQLGDSREVFVEIRRLGHYRHAVVLSALVPNERGMETAEDLARTPSLLEKIAVFTAASETFTQKNINATIAESLRRFEPLVGRPHAARGGRMLVRAYISCAIACPFEGPIAPSAVASLAENLVRLGVDEIDLGDTIGAGTPDTMNAMLKTVRHALGSPWWTSERLTLHLHDTFGHAAECVKVALDMGVRSFDGAVSGLGGCPYASTPGRRAPGNISTQTLVQTIHDAGFTTGVDLGKLDIAGQFATSIVTEARLRASETTR